MLMEQLADLKTNQVMIENEKNELEERLNKANDENDTLYQQNVAKDDEIQQINHDLDELKGDHADLEDQIKDLTQVASNGPIQVSVGFTDTNSQYLFVRRKETNCRVNTTH